MGAGGVGRSVAACEGAGHAEETPRHQQDRQPRNTGFQGLFSAAWIINLEVYNLWESCSALPVSCQASCGLSPAP